MKITLNIKMINDQNNAVLFSKLWDDLGKQTRFSIDNIVIIIKTVIYMI